MRLGDTIAQGCRAFHQLAPCSAGAGYVQRVPGVAESLLAHPHPQGSRVTSPRGWRGLFPSQLSSPFCECDYDYDYDYDCWWK